MTDATRTLGNTTYLRLKSMIVDGTLEPGTVLREKKFADRMGVSRTPVREAIGQLISEGLATRADGGAPVVSSVSLADIMEILHVRSLLECEAARKAAQSGRPLDALLDLGAEIRGYLNGPRPDAEVHSALDAKLHLTIAGMSGSALLVNLIEGLKVKTRMFDQGSIPDRFVPGCHEHLALIDAIATRDPNAAATAMNLHLGHVRESIISHIYHPF